MTIGGVPAKLLRGTCDRAGPERHGEGDESFPTASLFDNTTGSPVGNSEAIATSPFIVTPASNPDAHPDTDADPAPPRPTPSHTRHRLQTGPPPRPRIPHRSPTPTPTPLPTPTPFVIGGGGGGSGGGTPPGRC